MAIRKSLEKWFKDRCTVIQTGLTILADKQQVPTETTLASGVPCLFTPTGGGSLNATMLGQAKILQRKVYLGDTPAVKEGYFLVNDATGEKFTVVDAPPLHDGHQEPTVQRQVSA